MLLSPFIFSSNPYFSITGFTPEIKSLTQLLQPQSICSISGLISKRKFLITSLSENIYSTLASPLNWITPVLIRLPCLSQNSFALPDNFNQWLSENEKKMENWKRKPEFITKNEKIISQT